MVETISVEQVIGQKLLLAFKGKDEPSDKIIQALREYKPCGITLFRSFNIDNPTQVRELTESLQRLARDFNLPPLLIATDQEGGQLMAIGEGSTPLPGNMALGATGSPELARRAGEVLGRELAAMGINVNYAPCVDVNLNPHNPVVGIRSFGENPLEVAKLASAMIEGIQSQGVAATAKHFPGHGDTSNDSHHGLPILPHSLDRLQSVEFPPFQSSVRAGVKLIMSAHLGLTALDGPNAPPATLSANILKNLLRHQIGFDGVIVTDAMDMQAIRQGGLLGEDAVRAVKAGVDLLLLTSDPEDHERVFRALVQAVQNDELNLNGLRESVERIAALKDWIASHPVKPDLDVVGCTEHLTVANEIAEKSITLVRDHAGLLPLRLQDHQRLAVVIPMPQDLTPADTSSFVKPKLAESLREYHARVDEYLIPFAPTENDIAGLMQQLATYDRVVVGTINAFNQAGQAALVRKIVQKNIPVIVAALRLPYDLAAFPETPTYLCTYGILEPSMRALAKALFGYGEMNGRLPVSIPGLYGAKL